MIGPLATGRPTAVGGSDAQSYDTIRAAPVAHFDETGTTIAQATTRECMIESLGALELEPPPEGIQVSRQITLDLAPD